MSRFILYMDEDSQAIEVANTLRSFRVEVHRSADELNDGRSDVEQLEFATDEGRVIYTANTRHFAVLHRTWLNEGRSHSGIIFRTRQQFSIGEQARRIVRIWQALSAEEMVNRYESLSQWGEDVSVAR